MLRPLSVHQNRNFNPRVPCGTRRTQAQCDLISKPISTHASLAGRDAKLMEEIRKTEQISTHASLAGRDQLVFSPNIEIGVFQPTRPLRDATCSPACSSSRRSRFQPTRPLRDATLLSFGSAQTARHFNPRVPCGTRLHSFRAASRFAQFQPTRPLRDATYTGLKIIRPPPISTHASLAGRDRLQGGGRKARKIDFNPRVPCGTRHCSCSTKKT